MQQANANLTVRESSRERIYPAAALRRARMLVAAGWAQRVFATDKRGEPVACDGPRARGFSLCGALVRTSDSIDEFAAAWCALQRFMANGVSPETWQDAPERTLAEVLRLVDQATAELQGAVTP